MIKIFILHLLLFGGFHGLRFNNFDGRNLNDIEYQILDQLICEYLHERSYYTRRSNSRRLNARRNDDDDSDSSENDSEGYKQWFENWSNYTVWPEEQRGVVNMVAARPWGKPCGDPHQADAPPGTCMLPQECEPEYRIYRGDIDCGHTQFVCCAVQLEINALPSLEEPSGSSEELVKKNDDDKGCKPSKVKKKFDKHMEKRKKIMKNEIQKILNDIKKLLDDEVKEKGKKMKELRDTFKTMYKVLEDRYKKKHKLFGDTFKKNLKNADHVLKHFIKSIYSMNEHSVKNITLREILFDHVMQYSNKTMTLGKVLRLLDEVKDEEYRRRGIPLDSGGVSGSQEYK